MPVRSGTAKAATPETDRWIRRDGEPRLLDRPYALALLPAGHPAAHAAWFSFYLTPHSQSLSFSYVLMIALAAMFLALLKKRGKKIIISLFFFCCESVPMLLAGWLFKRTKAVLLRCLFFSQYCHCVISMVSKFRAPCRGRKFCGSAVLSRWMWSASVTLSCRSLWVFYGPKCPECPPLKRGRSTQPRALPAFFFSPDIFLLLLKKRAKQNGRNTVRLRRRLDLN